MNLNRNQPINDMDKSISTQGHYHNYIPYVPETRKIFNMSEVMKVFLNSQMELQEIATMSDVENTMGGINSILDIVEENISEFEETI